MDIYVKSRGVSKDYSWLWLDQNQINQNPITDPPNIKPVIEMVDSDYFSVVVYHVNGQLSLLVTGLGTNNRTDNRTRKIKNSVLWVGKASDEATLRSISIQALNGELEAKVDQAVKSEKNPQGFTVNFEQLKPETLNLETVEKTTADSNSKIGNLSALKNELINDLKQYSLPIKEGMLVVVVSSTVSQSSLEREKVWRGLSDTISGNQWIALEEDKNDNFRRQPSFPSSNTPTTAKSVSSNSENNTGKNNGNNKGIQPKPGLTIGQKVLSVLLAISLIINIALFVQLQEAIKNKEEYDRLRNESKALKIEIDKNKKIIETQEQKIAEQNFNLKKGGKILDGIIKFITPFNPQEGRQLLDDTNNFIKGIQK